MYFRELLCIVLFALTMGQEDQCNTGSMRLLITEPGLDFLGRSAFNAGEKKAVGFQFDGVDISPRFFFIVTSTRLSNITLSEVEVGESSFTTISSSIIHVQVAHISAAITGNYHWSLSTSSKLQLEKDEGTFSGNLHGLSVTANVTLERDEHSSSPRVSLIGCSPQLSYVDMNSTTEERAVELALDALGRNQLRHTILDGICGFLAQDLVSTFNEFFEGVSSAIPLASGVVMDLSLVCPPILQSDSILLKYDGKCYPETQPNLTFPYARGTLPPFSISSSMVHMMIDEYVIKTLLHSLFVSGVFNIQIDLDTLNIPGLNVNTRFLQIFFPGLFATGGRFYFPEPRPIRIKNVANVPPTIILNNSAITIEGAFDIILAVINPADNTSTDAVTFTADLNARGIIGVDSVKALITSEIDDFSFNLTVKNAADIGAYNVGLVNTFLRTGLSGFIIPSVNQFLEGGFPIPSVLGHSFANIDFTITEGVIEIRSDITDSPYPTQR